MLKAFYVRIEIIFGMVCARQTIPKLIFIQ